MRLPTLRRAMIVVVVLIGVLGAGAAAAVAVGGGLVRVQATTISGNGLRVIIRRTVSGSHTTGGVETVTEIQGHGSATRSLTRTLTVGAQHP